VLRFSTLGTLSETDLAQMFVAQNPNLRYVDREMTWYLYNGRYWEVDDICAAWNQCRKFAVQVGLTRTAGRGRIQSVKIINAIVKVASAHEDVAIQVDQLDTHKHLLNTPAGTYNLDTDEWLTAAPEHLLTRMTAVAPDAKMKIPLFKAHLELVTDGDTEDQDYLQREVGYCLCGHTHEDNLFFLSGSGGNGKGTLIDNITGPLGVQATASASYARTAGPTVFMATRQQQHPQALARLRGARLVATSEVPDGLWNEELLKLVTGGGNIEARFMHANSFEYEPQFKLIISGNHKPRLKNVDKAIARRFRLLPFTVDIEKRLGRVDTQMRTTKLRAEWPGILAWMGEGYKKYKKDGLKEPKVVQLATEAYLGREDALGNWLTEQCELTGKPSDKEQLAALYIRYSSWCLANGETIVRSKRMLRDDLEQRGIAAHLDTHTKAPVFTGIKLKPSAQKY
jgi:putative DNA primase/helicase